MRKYLYFILCLSLLSFGCDKKEVLPTASFTYDGESNSTLKVGTNDERMLINHSQNGQSYLWDFGDGRTSEEKDVVLFYPKSGTYEVKLTVTSIDGVKSESRKQVVVLDRVLKKIIIEQIQWITHKQEGLSFRWPTTSQADVFFQIQQYTNAEMEPLGIYPSCPVIYTSPVIKDVNQLTYDPIEIPVEEKIIIGKIRNSNYGYYAIPENLNQVYLYSLMAKDKAGDTFSLYHNGGGGNAIRIEKEDIEQNIYIVDFSQLSRIRLVCEYE
ncbi:PKD domain-containing protein [Pontibacter diazotrophicus]|uniref:PKD domain-containing protein n=1 Tax=Pontibacter diazotrophicus TaxID=1400979 RepID=A0A3D8LHK0_9BACT|nr:PKD domain-containing protein [Pontibacter diazotrophicus]RDV16816.1 PKD domain-containing protein [Pontibacter diazotrophicus]